jgi:O-antigen ligase
MKGWHKFIFVLLGILNSYLIWQTGTFLSYLAICCGALFFLAFYIRGWNKWLSLVLIISIPVILHFTDYGITDWAGRTIKMKNLLSHFSTDERIQVWPDAWRMLKDNSFVAWILGNGIGSVREAFPKYARPPYDYFVFPHCYFFEILYDNGIIGFVLIFSGLGFLVFSLMRKTRNIIDERMLVLVKCMTTLLLIWFIYFGLSFGFYSNYSLYPLGFILGTMLVLMERIPHSGVVQQDSQG